MAQQILFNIDQLNEVSALIPHTVRCIVHPETIVFPAIFKFILVHDKEITSGLADPEEAAIVPIVYAIPFDSEDLLTFYETLVERIERPGIEGYEYAESKETDEGLSRAIQAEAIEHSE